MPADYSLIIISLQLQQNQKIDKHCFCVLWLERAFDV